MMDLEAVYARNESLQAVFGDNQQRPSGSLRNISGNSVEFAQFDGENGEDWSCPAWTLSTAGDHGESNTISTAYDFDVNTLVLLISVENTETQAVGIESYSE
jgi:hypothetical protein